jgi:hypothetical protein
MLSKSENDIFKRWNIIIQLISQGYSFDPLVDKSGLGAVSYIRGVLTLDAVITLDDVPTF